MRPCNVIGIVALSREALERSLVCDLAGASTSGRWFSTEATAAQSFQPNVDQLFAETREASGTLASSRVRKTGRTPAILFSLPGNLSQLITLDARTVARLLKDHGRQGLESKLFSLSLSGPMGTSTYPVLPRQVHVNAVTDVVENVTLMHCPPERRVLVSVPVRVLGEDVSPGVKRGGYINVIRKRIRCLCRGSAIPSHINVDVSLLDFGGRIGLDAVSFPDGVDIAETALEHPVCKVAGRSARD